MSEKAEKGASKKPSEPAEKNTVYVGNKPSMAYVTAALFQIQQGSDQLVFKARGRAISRAVDVVEIIRRRFMKDKMSIKDIKIDTEILGEGADTRNVSTIELTVERKD